MQAPPAAQVKDVAAFEAEWERMGGVLRDRLGPPRAGALDGVRPAVVRALGEAALPQARVYYDASLEYGRNTVPEYGLYYLGAARSAAEVVELCRSLSRPGEAKAPPPCARSAREIEALEDELLAAYRPPLSIDRARATSSPPAPRSRRRASSTRPGCATARCCATCRRRSASRRSRPAEPLDAARVAERLRELDERLSAGDVDHSLGRLFLERAQEALAASPPDLATAAAIAADVLPRYFAALEPARPEPPRPEPRVTVTLVRWPYT